MALWYKPFMTLIIPSASSCLLPVTYEDEDEAAFEKDIVDHYRLFFGEKTLFIPKRKISGGALGNTIPDGFLFDCHDGQNPRFYIVEVELSKHSFGHIRSQIDRFLNFFSQNKIHSLVETIYDTVHNDNKLKQRWNSYCTGDMHHLMTRSIQYRHGVLVLFEKKNDSLEEAFDEQEQLYHLWQQKVQRIFIQKYQNDDDVFFHQEGGIGHQEVSVVGNSKSRNALSSGDLLEKEEVHLRKCSQDARATYEKIKAVLLENGLEQRVVGAYIGFWNNGKLCVSMYSCQTYFHFYVLHDDYKYFHDRDNGARHAQLKSMVATYEVEQPNKGHNYFYLIVDNTDHMDELLAYMNPVLS